MYLIDAHPASVFAAWIDWGWAEGDSRFAFFGCSFTVLTLWTPHCFRAIPSHNVRKCAGLR